jgi:hypothetical protein
MMHLLDKNLAIKTRRLHHERRRALVLIEHLEKEEAKTNFFFEPRRATLAKKVTATTTCPSHVLPAAPSASTIDARPRGS